MNKNEGCYSVLFFKNIHDLLFVHKVKKVENGRDYSFSWLGNLLTRVVIGICFDRFFKLSVEENFGKVPTINLFQIIHFSRDDLNSNATRISFPKAKNDE